MSRGPTAAGRGGRADRPGTGRELSMMSMTTNRRSFLFGASVAGFGILAQGAGDGRGASDRTSR